MSGTNHRPSLTLPAARNPVIVMATLMVLAQLGFRTWAVRSGWFQADDYRLITEARAEGLDLGHLFTPYDGPHFMPLGRSLAWVGSLPDEMSWPLLATMSMAMHTVAAVSCAWMLLTLFGRRRLILIPLGMYLSSVITMPAFMWWAAALNQVPYQAAFFLAVGAWVRYLRSSRLRWLLLTLAAVAFGLLCYEKALLVFPVLAFIALAWFAEGGVRRRLLLVLRRYWPAVVAGSAISVGFLAFYVAILPPLIEGARPSGTARAGEVADQMLGQSFASAVFGGPWRWDEQLAPGGLADPPAWAVRLCWVLGALAIAYLALRRERTGRAWVLLAGYVAADYLILLMTRAQAVGPVAGAEYRYLTDSACALVLAIGLATMELAGATEPSRPRPQPILARAVSRRVVIAGAVAVMVSGTYSSWSYARIWHTNHPGRDYFIAAVSDIESRSRVEGPIDLVNQFPDNRLTGALGPPGNRSDYILPRLTSDVRFPTESDALHLLDTDGRLAAVEIEPIRTTPRGPVEGCGWVVTEPLRVLPLDGPVIGISWWLRIDYLVSNDTGLRLRVGTTDKVINLTKGLGTRFVAVDGPFSAIVLGEVDPGVTLCVDRVGVGQPGLPGEDPTTPSSHLSDSEEDDR